MLKRSAMIAVMLVASVGLYLKLSSSAQPAIKHVIYVTLDGTRWQDVLQVQTNFPNLWAKHAANLTIYGKPGSSDKMEVASIPISLPSYQSQMTGAIQPCKENDCGVVRAETMPEHLLTAMHLKKQDVAVFSSWPVIADALESKHGTVYSNVGNYPVVDPLTGQPDDFMSATNHLQTLRHHFERNRMDEYTFSQALHYFEKYQPKFLWISLVNADNEAHMKHLQNYHNVLSSYDNYLDQLFATLTAMNLDKNTMVIITTDHGRGNKSQWTDHGPQLPESKATWAMVFNGKLKPMREEGGVHYYNTLSIRPTIEGALLGSN